MENVKEITALVKKAGDVDLYRRIVELQSEVVEISARNFELDKKCAKLEEELSIRKNLRHERSLYFLENDPIPYCPRCWEMNKQLIHLFQPDLPETARQMWWECHTCDHNFEAKKPDEGFYPRADMYRAANRKGR